ncbi:MAG: trypsin-like peptidase domain-containing protein [Deltaproteobacteria bacterium]|nr:trypsin-like peptidase domain-containing protein [Deltaproteobacteria bacterium]
MPEFYLFNNKNIFKVFLFSTIFFSLLSTFFHQWAFAEYPRQNAVVQAVSKVSPAVVNISSKYEVVENVNPFSAYGINPRLDSFFRDFFDHGYKQRKKRSSLGSGVIIDGNRGFILTNAHVIEEVGTITVTLKDEREYKARVVGADPDSDLAVLEISSEHPLPAVDMGNSSDVMIGETVIAIGNPFGFSNTVTTGVISATNRSIRTDNRVYYNFIQTDASINPGNSGGPLLNINGELIGINTAIYAKAQGIGFAIPINRASRIVSDLIKYGEVIHAWVGIVVQNIDVRLAHYLKLSDKKGVFVKGIEHQSPAEKAGIEEGDIILAINNNKLLSTSDYEAAIRNLSAGDAINTSVFRNNKTMVFPVKTSAYPLDKALPLAYSLYGVNVKKHSIGVVIKEIDRKSYLYKIGAEPGDIIRQINEIAITGLDDFKKAVIKYRLEQSAVILLQRGGRGYYITVRF